MYTFTCQVEKKSDLVLFHKMALLYLEKGSIVIENLLNNEVEAAPQPVAVPEPIQEEEIPKGLMGDLVQNCTCTGLDNCYSRLVRNDRVPWRLVKQNGITRYHNAKHGVVTVPSNCSLSDKATVKYGYIYEPRKDAKTIRAERAIDQAKDARNAQISEQADAQRRTDETRAKASKIDKRLSDLLSKQTLWIKAFNLRCKRCGCLQRTKKDVTYLMRDSESNEKIRYCMSWTCNSINTEGIKCGSSDWEPVYLRRVDQELAVYRAKTFGADVEFHLSKELDLLAQELSNQEYQLWLRNSKLVSKKVTNSDSPQGRRDWRNKNKKPNTGTNSGRRAVDDAARQFGEMLKSLD